MRKSWTVRSLGMAVAVLLGMVLTTSQSAQARPDYFKVFAAKYPQVKEASATKCNVCHVPEEEKKVRNVYGMAFGKTLGGTKVKDMDKIKKTLDTVEKQPSKIPGKTFGDLLKDGKLPASEK